jgi:Spy/CpxP family protein refolding chaperone
MKKKFKQTLISTMIFGLLYLTACSPRHSYHFHGHPKFASPEKRMEWLKEEITDRLELNEDQQARLDEMTNDLVDRGREMRAIRASIRDTLMTELRKSEMNKEDLVQVFSENRAKFEEMISLLADRLVEFHQMLQPEQRAKLVAELEKHQKRWEKYHR